MNADLIEKLSEFEYLQREGIVFNEAEKEEIKNICEAIVKNTEN